MLFHLILILFILVKISPTYHCIECFDFQCFDGGKKLNSNCFRCQNVSMNSRTQWLRHLEHLIYIGAELNKNELVIKLERKIKEGMYCCALEDIDLYETCSLTFSSGSKDGIPHYGMGCMKPDFWQTTICKNKDIGSRCCRQNHCNNPNITELKYMSNTIDNFYPNFKIKRKKYEYKYLIVLILCALFVFIVGAISFGMVKVIKTKHNRFYSPQNHRPLYKKLHCLFKLFSLIRDYYTKKRKDSIMEDITSFSKHYGENINDLSCSGSGAGKPLMTKRTASTDITLISAVGEGRFGTVWLGKWNGGDSVAVKIFSTRDERSWEREKQIYQRNFLRHANVLGYVATDSRDNGLATELWLVTDYHEQGSLYEYLRSRSGVTVEQAVKMARSITNGLAYLHNEINGTEFKPGIAHRDLKSRNILVKSCGECCIGDLGLAVRLNEDCSALDTNRVGTRRYMAPEVLSDSLVLSDLYFSGSLDVLKKADIYSYSLVLWEILRCCQCLSLNITPSQYEMPYQTSVSNDPSIEEMKDIVCNKKLRPEIKDCWNNINPLKEISKSIQESWFDDPSSRLTIMRLKKIMASAWAEVVSLRSTINDISSNINHSPTDNADNADVVISNGGHVYRYPFNNSIEFQSSLTSNDIPNIVIKTNDNVFCYGSDVLSPGKASQL